MIARSGVCLVFLDIQLPGRTGLEWLSAVRSGAANRDVPVIVITQFDFPEYRETARRLGVAAYVVKANSSLADIMRQMENALTGCAHGSRKRGAKKAPGKRLA